ncbi:MAG: hypothetical protein P1U58_20575, partial [Verrucomicrobiales bacterium]|nr:hypothetical protein [Verrucomicrobiales bacterium]
GCHGRGFGGADGEDFAGGVGEGVIGIEFLWIRQITIRVIDLFAFQPFESLVCSPGNRFTSKPPSIF